jgi:hypothetical protein
MRREIYCDEDSRNSWHATRGLVFRVHLDLPFDFENGKHFTSNPADALFHQFRFP